MLPLVFGLFLALLASPTRCEMLRALPIADCTPGAAPPLPFYAQSYGTVTLVVKPGVWDVDGQVTFTTRMYYYDQQPMVPGPIIRMQAGTQCQLRLVNGLSVAGNNDCAHVIGSYIPGQSQKFSCADATNVHMHGLHIDPTEDMLSVSVIGGAENLYTYNIQDNHAMGTHMYHPLQHGSASLQVAGGLYGMVDMLPAADAEPLPDDIAALYSDTNVYSYKMVMGHIFLGDGDPIEGDMSEWSLPELYELFGPQTVNPSSTIFTDNPDFYHINGQFQPTVVLASGNVGLFRMVHAGTTRALVLKFAVPNVCEMRLLARDGVFQQNGYVRVTRMVFFCGTRADFAILCKPPAATVYPLDIAVYADNQDIGPLVGNVHQQDVMFTVRIVSPEESQQVPPITVFPTSPVPLPSYMSDLTHAPVDWARIVDLDSDKINGVYFPGYNADPSIRYVHNFCVNHVHEIWLTGYPYRLNNLGDLDPQYNFTATSPDANEGRRARRMDLVYPFDPSYYADAGVHPYHQHTYPFQVMKVMDTPYVPYDFIRPGEWRDTVVELLNGTVVRTRPTDFGGEVVINCMFLQHADMGMIGLYNVSYC